MRDVDLKKSMKVVCLEEKHQGSGKMRKEQKVLLGLALILIGFLASCGVSYAKTRFTFTKNDAYGFVDWKFRISDEIVDWTDDQTGVHYLVVFDDNTVRAMSVRYDSDGKIMIDKEK